MNKHVKSPVGTKPSRKVMNNGVFKTSTFSNTALFQGFIKAYMEAYTISSVKLAILMLADQTNSGQYTFNPNAENSWDKDQKIIKVWPSVNSDVTLTEACTAIYDSQIRLTNIVQNPSYQNLKTNFTQEHMYTLVFNLLYYANVGSSFDVSEYSQTQFISFYYSYFLDNSENMEDKQQKIYADEFASSASNIRSLVMLQYMGISKAMNQKGRVVPWSSTGDTITSNYSDMPTFQNLFKLNEYIAVPEFESVLGPNAYLVDLEKSRLEFTDIIKPETNISADLTHRRPDIGRLPLTKDNTETEISKLEIVNNVLEMQLYAQANDIKITEVYQNDYDTECKETISENIISAADNIVTYPISAPFSYNQESTRSALTLMNTSLADLWQTVSPAGIDASSNAISQLDISIEQLGLNSGQYSLLSQSITDPTNYIDVYSRYGLQSKYSKSTDMSDMTVSDFQIATDLDGLDVTEAIYVDLSEQEIKYNNNQIQKTLYINGYANRKASDSKPIEITSDGKSFDGNCSVERFDRINRFIRLSSITNTNLSDLEWAVNSLQISIDTADVLTYPASYNYLATVKQLQSDYSISDYKYAVACLGFLKDRGTVNGMTQIQIVFGDSAPAPTYQQKNPVIWNSEKATDQTQQVTTSNLMAGTQLDLNDLLALTNYIVKLNSLDATQITLSQETLSAFYRISQISRLLKITISEILYLLDALDSTYSALALSSLSAISDKGGVPRFAEIYIALKDYISSIKSASLSVSDASYMQNGKITGGQFSAPGINETIQLIKDIFAGAESTLLTESAYDIRVSSDVSGDINIPDEQLTAYLNAIYEQFSNLQLIDKRGVVIKASVTAKELSRPTGLPETDFDLIVKATNTALQSYKENQNLLIANTFSKPLSVATEIALTIPSWSIFWKNSAFPFNDNALHVFYSMIIDEGKTADDLTSSSDIKDQLDYFSALSRFSALINGLTINGKGLNLEEVQYILQGHSQITTVSFANQFKISSNDLTNLASVHSLYTAYADPNNNLLTFLGAGGNASVENLSAATGWESAAITDTLTSWGLSITALTQPVVTVTSLQSLFTLSANSYISTDALMTFRPLAGVTLNKSYAASASLTENALYSANPADAPATISLTLNIPLDEGYRDILVETLLYYFRNSTDPVLLSVGNVQALSEYLLSDVLVTSKYTTSPVKEAIGAYQTYFYRIQMSLEPHLTVQQKFIDEYWPWFKNYRVWEANREVFVNPENYLEPDLRANASDIFQSFKNTLNQGQVNDDTINTAFMNYVQDFGELANLRTVASHLSEVDEYGNATLIIIAVTVSAPYTIYSRIGTLQYDPNTEGYSPASWTSWDKLDINIPTSFISGIYAFDRMYLFWPEITLDGSNVRAKINYCYYQDNKQWSTTQTLNNGVLLGAKLDASSDFSEDSAYNTIDLTASESSIIAIYPYVNTSLQRTSIEYTIDKFGTVIEGNSVINIAGPDQKLVPSYMLFGNKENKNCVKTGRSAKGSGWVYPDNYDISYFKSPDQILFKGQQSYYFNNTVPVTDDEDTTTPLMPRVFFNATGTNFNYDYINKSNPDAALWVGGWYYFESFGDGGKYDRVTIIDSDTITISIKEGTVYQEDSSSGFNAAVSIEDDRITTNCWLYINVNVGYDPTVESVVINLWCGRVDETGEYLTPCLKGGTPSAAVDYEYNQFPTVYTIKQLYSSDFKQTSKYSFYLQNPEYAQMSINTVSSGTENPTDDLTQYVMANYGFKNINEQITGLPFNPENPKEELTAEYVPNSNEKMYIMRSSDSDYLSMPLNSAAKTQRFERMSSSKTAADLSAAYRTGGVDKLLSTETQLISGSNFSRLNPDDSIIPKSYWPSDNIIDFMGANSIYLWEMFCFAPWTVANTYSNGNMYEKSLDWYKYIFDPTIRQGSISDKEKSIYESDTNKSDLNWRYIGLKTIYDTLLAREVFATGQGRTAEDLEDMEAPDFDPTSTGSEFMTPTAMSTAMLQYIKDPFDPHAIAMLRPIAYQEALVLHYVQVIMNYADALYTQETRESIQESVILYMQASDLLGARPVQVGEFSEASEAPTLLTIREESEDNIKEFLVGLEPTVTNINLKPTAGTTAELPYNYLPGLYFGIPQNDQVSIFQDTIENRLNNIRNNLDIQGQPMALSLFQPAIDVMSLVSAVGSGQSLSEAVANALSTKAPIYRFPVLLSKAKEFSGYVTSFGQQLLSSLEKQDAQHLELLLSTQQGVILDMMKEMKQDQINSANAAVDTVVQQVQAALLKKVYYQGLQSWSISKTSSKALSSDATSSQMASSAFTNNSSTSETDSSTEVSASYNFNISIAAQVLETLGATSQLISTITQGLAVYTSYMAAYAHTSKFVAGTSNGFLGAGEVFGSQANAFGSMSFEASYIAGALNTQAAYQRREEEWKFQEKLADQELQVLNSQYEAAVYQLNAAKRDYEVLDKQISQNAVVQNFHRSKFSNEALYKWMAGQLSATYNQAYTLARSTAKEAQTAIEFEKGLTKNSLNIIRTDSWNSNYRGLLAGEQLQHSLNMLDKHYMDIDTRSLEIVKTISLASFLGNGDNSLQNQIKKSSQDYTTAADILFSITQSDYNDDFKDQGMYRRLIKYVTVSIPAVVGPYEDIRAILAQSSNAVYVNSGDTTPRNNWGSHQKVVLSRAQDDSGLFVPSLQDPRYMPFEGTGAISSWSLSIFNTDLLQNISDIIVTINYTARS